MNYTEFTDEQLVESALQNSEQSDSALEELFNRYKSRIYKIVRPLFLTSGDENDLVQEGMIGLFKAIKSYNHNGLFAPYAHICIKNAVLSAIKKSNRKKNMPLNDYISLSGGEESDENKNVLMSDLNSNPEKTYIEKEEEDELESKLILLLSPLENKVLDYYLDGFSYEDIAAKIGKNVKSVDNAVQRIRNKLTLNKKEI